MNEYICVPSNKILIVYLCDVCVVCSDSLVVCSLPRLERIMEFMNDTFIQGYHNSPDFQSRKTQNTYEYTGLNTRVASVTLLECAQFSHIMDFLHITKIGEFCFMRSTCQYIGTLPIILIVTLQTIICFFVSPSV